jgi:hypothetical protein
MKVKYLAFDSMGVKSMCVHVRTADCSIIIDPGISSEDGAFPMHFRDKVKAHLKYKRKIERAARDSKFVVITHYHWDHFMPERNENIYRGKIMLVKNPNADISAPQRARAARFFKNIHSLPEEVRFADGRRFSFGKTKIKFSPAFWHAPRETDVGYVLMVTIDDGDERLVFTSDTGGPHMAEYARYIAGERPATIVMDGFPTYLLGGLASVQGFKKALENAVYVIQNSGAKNVILDHRLLRDYRYREMYHEFFHAASDSGVNVRTAAEIEKKEPAVIEGYKKYGPTWWSKWERMTFRKLNSLIVNPELCEALTAKEPLKRPLLPSGRGKNQEP